MSNTVLGPTPPRARFPRNRYVAHLLRTQRELDSWAYTYACSGTTHRAEVCQAAANFIDKAIYELLTVKV